VPDRRDRGGQRAVTDAGPTELEGALDGGLARRTLGSRNGSRAAVDYERGRSQGFSSGRLEGPAVHGAALLHAPVGDEQDPPADGGAIRGAPLGKPPVGVRTSISRAPFGATRNLVFAAHHSTLLSDVEVLDPIAPDGHFGA